MKFAPKILLRPENHQRKTRCLTKVCMCGLYSSSTANMVKIEEMERMLREAQAEKNRLLDYRVHQFLSICMLKDTDVQMHENRTFLSSLQEREMELRRQALEDERRRREELERRLQEETNRRQKLVEKEVKLWETWKSSSERGRTEREREREQRKIHLKVFHQIQILFMDAQIKKNYFKAVTMNKQ